MPQITQDWSEGPMGPGWFIMFPTNVPARLTPGGGGSGGGSVASFLPQFDPPGTRRIRTFDDDEAIALALLEL